MIATGQLAAFSGVKHMTSECPTANFEAESRAAS